MTSYYYEDLSNYSNDINHTIELLVEFTEIYKKYYKSNKETCEALCLKIQSKIVFGTIESDDLLAGRIVKSPIGFAPQSHSGSFAYYFDELTMEEMLSNPNVSDKNLLVLEELEEFWKTQDGAFKTRKAFPDQMQKVLNSDLYWCESGIGFPLYRMGGSQLDYEKLIDIGIPGLREEIARYKHKAEKDESKTRLYQAMEIALDTFCELSLKYADMAAELAKDTYDSGRKGQLVLMEKALRNITQSKPDSFREGVQITWLYYLLSGTYNFGRMDNYLGDLYAWDIDNKVISEEESLEILISLWKLMNTINRRWDSRVFIGGKGRRDEKNADRFALLAMEATRRNKDIMPQLSLRFYEEQNPALYQKALTVIGEGCTFPMLYNDDINIVAVQNAFKVSKQEAVNYLPYGCGEYVLYHRSFGTPSGVINLLQALLVTLKKGIDPSTKKPMGLPPSSFGNFETFDELFQAYKNQVEYYVIQLAEQQKLEYDIAGQTAPFLYFSMLYDDCIKRSKAMFDGGVCYLGGTLEAYGNTNTADSLVAIKDLVYDKKLMSLEELNKILNANFEGYAEDRKMMLDLPKYGNDNEVADNMKVEVDRHICTFTRSMAKKVGLHSYLTVNINNSANTSMGMNTAASPDGRKGFTYMANGNAPTSGADKSGVTAMLKSIVKPDVLLHAGAVQNMKFSKQMFLEQRPKLEALMGTYWKIGGAQAMVTVLGRDDLENAIKSPDEYQNLIVRVGGFSARFVELEKEVQLEILSRMMY